jgi:hypothetical protein
VCIERTQLSGTILSAGGRVGPCSSCYRWMGVLSCAGTKSRMWFLMDLVSCVINLHVWQSTCSQLCIQQTNVAALLHTGLRNCWVVSGSWLHEGGNSVSAKKLFLSCLNPAITLQSDKLIRVINTRLKSRAWWLSQTASVIEEWIRSGLIL